MTKYLKVLIILVLLAGSSLASAEAYKIAVVKSRASAFYDAAAEGIARELKTGGINCVFSYYDLQGDKTKRQEILSKIKAGKPQQILTIGTLASQVVGREIKNIPIIFTMVLNPAASGIVPNMRASGSNITGVSLDIPLEEQFENFRLVVPQARKIGVIYNPGENGITVADAKGIAKNLGLTLFLVPIGSPQEVPGKLEQLKGIDGLWIPADSVVFTPRNTEYILLYALKEKIPFMGISQEFVKAGALFGKMIDLEAIYPQTAKQMIRVLKGGNPATIPVTMPEKISLVLNLRTAETIGMDIPLSTINSAEIVFK